MRAGRASPPPVRAERSEPGIGLLRVERRALGVVEDLVVAPDAHPAPVESPPLRAVDQLGASDPHGVVHLGHLDRHQSDVRHVGVDPVDAVAVGVCAGPSPDDVGQDRSTPRHWRDALDVQPEERDARRSDRLLGPQVGGRADDRVRQSLARVVADAHGGRRVRVQDVPLGADHVDRAQDPFVRGERGIQERAHGVYEAGAGARPRHVQGAGHLWGGPREVDRQAVAGLPQVDVDPGRGTVAAIVVHEPLGLALAVGELAERGPHRTLDDVHRLRERRPDGGRPEPLDRLLEPAPAEQTRGALSLEVRDRRARVPDVLGEDRQDVGVLLAAHVEADRREHQPLRVHLLERGPLGPRVHPADVEVVRGRAGPRVELAADEHGGDHVDVGRVHRPKEGMVRHEDVPVGDPVAPCVDDRPHDEGHRAELRGDVVGLGDQVAVRGEEGAGEVLHVPDDRAVRGALQDAPHLLGGGEQRRVDQLERDRIEAGHRRAVPVSRIHMSPLGSTVTR